MILFTIHDSFMMRVYDWNGRKKPEIYKNIKGENKGKNYLRLTAFQFLFIMDKSFDMYIIISSDLLNM